VLTFGSLFAGIGGFDLGFERAGMQCKWQVEIDDWCSRVLAKHWPEVNRYGDIRECGRHNLEAVDVICGGFPCQPVSSAGKRQAQADLRWLWPEFARIITELRPKYAVMENVPGLLHRGMGNVLVDLAEAGYDAEWNCIPASALGAPHKRERVIIVAYTRSTGLERCIRWSELDVFPTDNLSTPQLWAHWPDDIPKPFIDRSDDGFSRRMERLSGLGNALVPQLAEWIGRQIVAVENSCQNSQTASQPL